MASLASHSPIMGVIDDRSAQPSLIRGFLLRQGSEAMNATRQERSLDAGRTANLAALAGARPVRRRELALVEQYLTQTGWGQRSRPRTSPRNRVDRGR
jgi:hypothetical protein